jgi:hypothetical protein
MFDWHWLDAWHCLPLANFCRQIELAQNDWPAVQRLSSQSASVWQSAEQIFGGVPPVLRQAMFSPTQLLSSRQGNPK